MAESREITFVNGTDGPKGVHGVSGVVMIEAGQSAAVTVTEAEFNSARSTGWFSPAHDNEEGERLPSLTGKNKADLLAIAEVEGVAIEDGATNADIVSAIELHREA